MVLSINEGECSDPDVLFVRTDSPEFVLLCVVLGIPTPTVQWIVLGLPVETAISVDMTGRLVNATYTLTRIMFFDFEGNYTCVANNSLGVVSRTILVRRLGESLCDL